MSAEEPIDITITGSSERVWRFEPSPGSRAVWENDMLVEMIYRYVHRLDGSRAVINGMVLCKSRFWLMARILYRDCHVHDVVQTFLEECSLERFTGYLNSVRILRLDGDDLQPDGNFTAKEVASRRRAQMPNLKEVRPVESCDNHSTIERTIEIEGQQIVVEHFVYPFRLDALIETNISVGPSDAQTEGILTGVKIRPHPVGEVEEAQLGLVIALLNRRPSLGLSMSQTHPFANLRTLELLPSLGWRFAKLDQLDRLHTLDQILSVCPRLGRLACRLKDSPVTAKTLNRVFSKGKNLVSVHIETHGFLTPYLSALSRFEQVTLACTTLLTETDLDLLYGHVKPDQPFIPRLRHFTYGVTTGLIDAVRAGDTPCNKPYSVARLIRKLLPRDCVFATSTAHYHSAYGLKEPMTQWWKDFTGIMDIMMKEIDPPQPAIMPLPREP